MKTKQQLYIASYKRLKKRIDDTGIKDADHDTLKKYVFYTIRLLERHQADSVTQDLPSLRALYLEYMALKTCIEQLTPNDFLTMFPVDKEYTGLRRGKYGHYYGLDYYHTMDFFKSFNPEAPISNALEFLSEYNNRETHKVMYGLLDVINRMRALEGLPMLVTIWANPEFFNQYELYHDNSGNPFVIDNGKIIHITLPESDFFASHFWLV